MQRTEASPRVEFAARALFVRTRQGNGPPLSTSRIAQAYTDWRQLPDESKQTWYWGVETVIVALQQFVAV